MDILNLTKPSLFIRDFVTPLLAENCTDITSPEENKSSRVIIIICAVILSLIMCLALIALKLIKDKRLRTHSDTMSLNNSSISGLASGKLNLKKISLEDLYPRHSVTRVSVSILETHFLYLLQPDALKKEFMKIRKGKTNPWLIASAPQNIHNNRYKNILAYDHSRVVLHKWPENFSEYINANYINGYAFPKKYIAAQGPMESTVLDFWKMVWQANVLKIVMVTSIMENEKVKCTKYWPETTEKYGSVMVTLKHATEFEDFVIRMFEVNRGNSTRKIKHYQFLSWPTGSVPTFISPLVRFISITRSYLPDASSPILVHCSAGVGRTGTIIAIDIMLDMAEEEKHIDLHRCVQNLRKQRVNLVETIDQYALAYKMLVEFLCKQSSSLDCKDFRCHYKNLHLFDTSRGQSYLEIEFQNMKNMHPAYHTTEECDPLKAVNEMVLSESFTGRKNCASTTIYINGYQRKNEFIIHSPGISPLNFWKRVYESNSKTIVLLHRLKPVIKVSKCYWPEQSYQSYGDYLVTPVSNESIENRIKIRTFKIFKVNWMITNESGLTVKQFHVASWDYDKILPPNPSIILELIQRIEEWKKQIGDHQTTIQCIDDISRCGLFCAAVCICNQMKMEKTINIIEVVKNVQQKNPLFMENIAQYSFLYDIVNEYLDQLVMHTDFK